MSNYVDAILTVEMINLDTADEKIEYLESLVSDIEDLISEMRQTPWDYE